MTIEKIFPKIQGGRGPPAKEYLRPCNWAKLEKWE